MFFMSQRFAARQATRQWLSFEEARSWASSLGLRSVVEWKAYPNRRIDVPANPREVYGETFLGYPHWLGYGGPSMSRVTRKTRDVIEERKKPLHERAKTYTVRNNSLISFSQLFPISSGIQLFYLPLGCRAHILFRTSEAASAGVDLWAGILFVIGTCSNSSSKQVCIPGHSKKYRNSGSVFIGTTPGSKSFLVLPNSVRRSSKMQLALDAPTFFANHEFAPYLINEDEMRSHLRMLYETEAKFSKAYWLSNPNIREGSSRFSGLKLMAFLDRVVFRPHGYDMSFPLSNKMSACNMIVQNNLRIFARSATYDRASHKWYARINHVNNGRQIPLHEDDEFDFVLVCLPSSEKDESADDDGFLGFYFFPKTVLVQRKIVTSASGCSGVVSLSLYGPFDQMARRKNVIERQQWQASWYFRASGSHEIVQNDGVSFSAFLSRIVSNPNV